MSFKFACPRCFGGLRAGSASSLNCPACRSSYPVIDGTPVLLVNADQHLARAAFDLQAQVEALEHRAAILSAKAKGQPWRTQSLADLRGALQGNARLFAAQRDQILDRIPPLVLAQAAQRWTPEPRSFTQQIFRYLARDWSGSPEAEREIAVIRTAVLEALKQAGGQNGTAVLLGAGAGRYAHELSRRFSNTVALELSIPLVLAHAQARAGTSRFHLIQESNSRRAKDRVHFVDTRAVAARFTGRRVYSVAADSAFPPVLPNSASAVVSIYFTDVIPLRDLLPAVMRILEPGGTFVHFGPLAYHSSDDPTELYAADELRRAVEEAGFEVHSERWIQTTHLATSSLRRKTFLNWSFAATAPKRSPGRLTLASRLRIQRSLSVETVASIQPSPTCSGEPNREVTLRAGASALQISPDVLHILELIDGRLTLGEIVAQLKASGFRFERADLSLLLDTLKLLELHGYLGLVLD